MPLEMSCTCANCAPPLDALGGPGAHRHTWDSVPCTCHFRSQVRGTPPVSPRCFFSFQVTNLALSPETGLCAGEECDAQCMCLSLCCGAQRRGGEEGRHGIPSRHPTTQPQSAPP